MTASTPQIDIDGLGAGQTGATVLAVREAGEYIAGHVPGGPPLGRPSPARSGPGESSK